MIVRPYKAILGTDDRDDDVHRSRCYGLCGIGPIPVVRNPDANGDIGAWPAMVVRHGAGRVRSRGLGRLRVHGLAAAAVSAGFNGDVPAGTNAYNHALDHADGHHDR